MAACSSPRSVSSSPCCWLPRSICAPYAAARRSHRSTRNVIWRTVARLQGNARIETASGCGVLGIVGALGTLPPGLHSEPGSPSQFRLDIGALTLGPRIVLAILTAAVCVCAVAAVAAAAAGHYRRTGAFAAGLLLCLGFGWLPLRPAIERAYPTSYAPTQRYLRGLRRPRRRSLCRELRPLPRRNRSRRRLRRRQPADPARPVD